MAGVVVERMIKCGAGCQCTNCCNTNKNVIKMETDDYDEERMEDDDYDILEDDVEYIPLYYDDCSN